MEKNKEYLASLSAGERRLIREALGTCDATFTRWTKGSIPRFDIALKLHDLTGGKWDKRAAYPDVDWSLEAKAKKLIRKLKKEGARRGRE